MELNSQVNTFARGMNMDADITMIPEGQYRYAENIRLLTNADGTTGVLQNIESIKEYEGGIPSDDIILGTAVARVYDDATKGTKECGIVLTINGNTNKIYKITGFESSKLNAEIITYGNIGITDNVSIITNYESDRVSNIYICDGNTPIKVINIYDENLRDAENNAIEITDPTRFDITPGCILLPFVFQNTIAGVLPAGSIQYCYQLFNLNGPETTTSALSEVIPITMYYTEGETSKIKGQVKGELSDRGCRISAKFKNDGRFNRARIFSIIYLDNTSIPDIYIINEVEIPNTGARFNEFTYDDTGSSYISKITIDEFNAMVPFEFNAKCLQSMGNRLFAANVQELTWDISYDARAYRCDKNGTILLENSDTSKNIYGEFNSNGVIVDDSGNIITIPDEHDCINPSNVDIYNPAVYIYGCEKNASGERLQGGCGPNVSYKFLFTELVNSNETVQQGKIADNLKLSDRYTVSNIYTYYEDGTQKGTNIFNEGRDFSQGGKYVFPNYADPYICANYTGYKRDEIYRFGIIFYNNKNIPSPVHWIGDIRMPSIHNAKDKDSLIYPFHTGVRTMCHSGIRELVSYALGIEFTVRNIPGGVHSYEIVRQSRNETNRTIVTQGIVGGLFSFDTWGDNDKNFGTNDVRPAPMFSLASNFITGIKIEAYTEYCDTHEAAIGYLELVSPEVCIMKDSISHSLQNSVLCRLYNVNSLNSDTGRVTIPQTEIQSVSEDSLVPNDPDFGKAYYNKTDGFYVMNMGYGKHNGDWNGYAGVFKYYNIDTCDNETTVIESATISNVLPYKIDLDGAKSYAQFIGNKTYVNLSVGGKYQFSNHGLNAVLVVDSSYRPHMDVNSSYQSLYTAMIADIKRTASQSSGTTHINRQNTVYASCNCFSDVDNSVVSCYGGDTYLGVLDYLNTSMIQQTNDPNDYSENRLCCVCYIPLESSINLNLRSDDSYHRTTNGSIGQNLVQSEPSVLPNGYTQKKPYYEYNPVYSATSGSKQYVSKGIYSVDNQINQTRIVVSELKTNNEMTDSWTKFKFANYIDVDSKYGQITNLKTFNDKLFYWQDNAVGVAAVNERSLITDNNMAELALGTGGVLSRFDYIATLNGSSVVNDKSITNSATTLYWYDFDKNEICVLGNNGVTQLSKLKGTQSYLNQLPKEAKKNVVSFYDKKYNEVWFKIYNKSLIYNEQLTVFTSFYTHDPNWFFPFSDKLVSVKNNNTFHLHNIYVVDSLEGRKNKISKIEFVVNKDVQNTKVFDNVLFTADLIKTEGDNNNIISDICFKTKSQHTQSINESNIDCREDNYRFAIPRESTDSNEFNKLASQSYSGRMRGKYLICDYTFDCNNNREFKLPYIKTTYRYSML